MTSRQTRRWLTAACALLLVSFATWAAGQARSDKGGSAASTQAQLDKAKQKLAQQQAQTAQLQDSVAKQETNSRQASERLQQQDKTIAQMQQELQALQAKQPAGHR